ncbi:hect e3 ubiquitin [Plasmopara halstedii]|uniref:HECT-type E3 ubiquitin transferase n=1 Tax=Plasmopara halstedii TaxID=4781 RepID=A0A0P1AWB3_PLAHL|nr:hect e3 ubiquitin [Plasmopara halstedii]CEG45730.1 hect e3 ubiquitin [Plasmopara halstedii]|eukprot:XP_024582099.1 hect e3 ubiquitin [Plasmopara halstedii]
MTAIFGQELSSGMAALVYVFLVLALVILCGSIWYYWSYARKIERFLARDNQNNNMMRHHLVDSFLQRGEEEWPCSICFHDNHPDKTSCVMCGTPRIVTATTPSNLARASGLHKQNFSQSMLNQQSRVRSFHVRRLKQMDLTSRQKAAMRRHVWKRKRGKDGVMRWVRIDAKQNTMSKEKSSDSVYAGLSTPTNGTAILGGDDFVLTSTTSRVSSTSSLKEDNEIVARALRDFGVSEEEGRHPDSSFLSTENDLGRPSFQPLRATALQLLEEAEERPTMAFYSQQNPFNRANSGVNPFGLSSSKILLSGSTTNPFANTRGLNQINEDREGTVDGKFVSGMKGLGMAEDRRFLESNDTALSTVSTGYVRHENGAGGFEWTPAGTVIAYSDTSRRIECEDDLEEIASLTFHDKNRWFLEQVQKRWRSYEEGHIQFVVRREHVVSDSMEQMLKCPPSRFWERLRIYFENEPGLDAGGLIREWYEILSDSLFNDDYGLFIATKGENMGYWINPASASKVPNHLEHYEFIGRLLAKALIEGYNMKMSLALPLIKHILGVPISFSDLEFLDEDLYKNAMWMKHNDHADLLAIDFTVQVITSEGKSHTVELVPGGAARDVTDENKEEYLELLLKHYMFESISEQLGALLMGFYDIMPQFLITVFDYQEFDLLLSGVPELDVNDWHTHSEVRWIKLEKSTPVENRVLKWFWECMREFTSEERARLLQFATGTSRVPIQGFKALTSSDGRVRRFTIQFVQRGAPPTGLMPKGHTCFNRIDLPLYHTKEEMINYLTLVMNMEISGFWME